MSSPSDNEKSKHTDEESLSDKESFSDEQKVPSVDRKKKRKSKELLKSPSKIGAATSGTSKKGDVRLIAEDSDSNSGEKRVGVVGGNIKQLNLNEGDKVKDSNNQKDGLKSTEVQAGIGVDPGISIVSQPEPVVESSNDNQNVQVPPSNEQALFLNENMNVPNNSLNEPRDSVEIRADLRLLPSSSMAYRRQIFSEKEGGDTLDDVSEIISDSTDITSDTSIAQVPVVSKRQPYQGSSSDAKAEDLSESSESEGKVAEQKSKNGRASDILSDSNGNAACQDNVSEKSDSEQKIVIDKPSACGVEEKALQSTKVVDPHGSNGQSTNGKDGKLNVVKDPDNQHCGEQGNSQDVCIKDVTEHQASGEESRLQAGSKELLTKESMECEEVEDQVEEHMEEPDGSVHQDESVEENESNSAEPIEDPDNNRNDNDEEVLDDQLNNEDDQELVVDDSSDQGGLNIASPQESSSDYQNFVRGQYVRFPIDSTTTDSGIENSLDVFGGNYQVPDNSESNEGSALGSSGAAGLQNLNIWIDRGGAVAPLPELDEQPDASNVAEQEGPSASYASNIAGRIVKVAISETLEDFPMECAQHFAETPSEGSIVEVMPEAPLQCEKPVTVESEVQVAFGQKPDSSGTNPAQVQLEKENLNVISGVRSPSNEPNAEITSSGANAQEQNPDVIDEENNSLPREETSANNNPILSLNPKTSHRISKEDSDQLSSSSQELSRESSLADMDDAIESSDSLAEPSQTATNLLLQRQVLLAKVSDSKLRQSKRPAKKSGENNSPFKKRKDAITCGQQAGAAMESLKKRKPDSDDESSKDDGQFK